MIKISFGTDGWRGIISREFTYENIGIISQAIAAHLHKEGRKGAVAVGYDTRFMSGAFAGAAAEALAGCGFKTLLSSGVVPTPALSYFIKQEKLAGGVMITASHNPWQYSGIKFKPYFGGSASEGITKSIESFLYKKAKPVRAAKIETVDMLEDYKRALLSLVDTNAIEKLKRPVVIDSMNGAGGRILEDLLAGIIDIRTINFAPDPLFGGRNPEPIDKNLGPLFSYAKKHGFTGFATDGDADRVGGADETGAYLSSHKAFALILLDFLIYRGLEGRIAKAVSSTSLINKIAERHSREVAEVKIGFKYICELMMSSDVELGGEESGGIGYRAHIPERDGLMSSLLMMEYLGKEGVTMRDALSSLEEDYGRFVYMREDLHTEAYVEKKKFIKTLKDRIDPDKMFAGKKLMKMDDRDGIKFFFDDYSWLLLRPSGTEPLVRVYAESGSKKDSAAMIRKGCEIAKGVS